MRYAMMGAFLAALATAAQGQQTGWGFFEAGEGKGVGVQAADGSQFMLKCDKPGKGEVYAVVVTQENLVPPQRTDFTMRPAEVRFDARPPAQERWRFYERSAVAINKGAERTLSRLLLDLPKSTKLKLRLNPERARWVEAEFDVTGAQEAIAQIYSSCQDDIPVS